MTRQFEIRNTNRVIDPIVVGNGIPKIVVNLGLTNNHQSIEEEVRKAQTAIKYGASIIADVSTIGNIRIVHKALMDSIDKPLNVVPLYEIYQRAHATNRWNTNLSRNEILEIIQAQAESGVDCMTLHSSYKSEYYEKVKKSPKLIRIQSRGGGIIHEFFTRTENRENPLYEYFDDILVILNKYHISLSLGSCLRNGSADDILDDLIQLEIMTAAELVNRAINHNVNVMVEGVSHIKFALIQPFVSWVKAICHDVPLRLLGPVGTEKGLGYDHITAAICATEAVRSGLDIITCITRAEHIGLPSIDEIRESVVATQIAIELATQKLELGKHTTGFQCGLGFGNLREEDFFDLEKAIELKIAKNDGDTTTCSMCKEFCRIKLNPEIIKGINYVER